jgi:hypothetical protein
MTEERITEIATQAKFWNMNGSFARFYWLPFALELLRVYEEEKVEHE